MALTSLLVQQNAAFVERNLVECLSAFIGVVIAGARPQVRFIQTGLRGIPPSSNARHQHGVDFIGSWVVVNPCGDPVSVRPFSGERSTAEPDEAV